LRRDLARHLASDFDAFCADSAEAVNIGFAIDNHVPSADAPWNFACVVNRRGFGAMQIPAQPAFNQGGSAYHAAAGQIAFAGQMHIAAGSDASAETARDFVVAEINVRATGRADCRSRCAADLLFSFTIKAFDNRTVLSLPKVLELAKNGGTLCWRRFFRRPKLEAGFRREWQKRAAALATD
jgi:hypothetical protein